MPRRQQTVESLTLPSWATGAPSMSPVDHHVGKVHLTLANPKADCIGVLEYLPILADGSRCQTPQRVLVVDVKRIEP